MNRNAMRTPPPVGGGSETGVRESPSISDVELEYNVILPDKSKGRAVPDNTAQGGSGHDPPRNEETSRLSRRHESGDCSRSHSERRRPTRSSDDKEILDSMMSKIEGIEK